MSALTTTFTRPASCTQTGIMYFPIDERRYFLLQGEPAVSTECYPSGYSPERTAFYSPGICPSGYTTACSALETSETVTETLYTCCPTQLKHSCLTDVNTRYPWQSRLACYSAITTEADGRWTLTAVTTISNGRTEIGPQSGTETIGAVNAHGIQVKVWDGAFPTSTAATSTSTPTSTSISISTPSASASQSTQPSSGGLSTGAAAGIGVGAGAALILSAVGFWLLRRRKRRAPKQPVAPAGDDDYQSPLSPPPFVDPGLQEMSANEKPPITRHELSGDSQTSYHR